MRSITSSWQVAGAHRAWGARRLAAILTAIALFSTIGIAMVDPPAHAADGNILRTITAQGYSCSVGTGIAFDGTNLLLSCNSDNIITAVNPSDGSLVRTYTLSGVTALGALAWDRGRGLLWACGGFGGDDKTVFRIDLGTQAATVAFSGGPGCVDGLAYDGSDDTLWLSPDVSPTVYHYSTDGNQLASYPANLGACGNSGLAVGGAYLFLANNGCSQIYRAVKSDPAATELFGSYPARLEDMECDDLTFGADGKAAIWSKDAYDAVLNAFELNPGDCGFGGLPPGNKFVYVALGDSYQAGEGAGNSLHNTDDYLTKAYERNTYTDRVVPGGDSCHRSLANYAKINRDQLEPGADVVLIDVTCSGAKIEPGNKDPVVGVSGSPAIDPASQVATALTRLRNAGLSADDVDFVTVGMGGNDAKFGEIVAACLLPNIVRRLLRDYPNSPREVEFVANRFATCENADNFLFKTGPAIDALADKETWAQGKLLDAFGQARILQLNYPGILPAKKGAPSWCGGVRKEDLDFARRKVVQIDGIVADTVRATAARDPRFALLNLKDAFGSNALCPRSAEAALANGLNEQNFNAELRRLLNLDGNGDREARGHLDRVVKDYNDYKQCLRDHYNPLGRDCDTGAALDRLKASAEAAMKYLQSQMDLILANLIASPGGGEDVNVRFDRSRGLFHPNANGYAVMACHVRAAYSDGNAGGCLSSTSPLIDEVNGRPVGNAPITGGPGVRIHIRIGGFEVNAEIRIVLFSAQTELGKATADSNGVVDTELTLPDADAGVHTLELQGPTPGGSGMHKRVRVSYPGRPSGDGGYATYLCCFTPTDDDTAQPEQVDVIYLGDVFETLTPDEDGGVFVELPLLDLLDDPSPLTITGRSRTTGKTVTTAIEPIPSVAGLYATRRYGGALSVRARDMVVHGLVHSNGGLTVRGSQIAFTAGTEYATRVKVKGRGIDLSGLRRVDAGGLPFVWQIADFRPGGTRAVSAGASYHAIPKAACSRGTWRVPASDVPAGVVYVPCAVAISGSHTTIPALLVAEGPIRLNGANLIVDPGPHGPAALLTAAGGSRALRVTGSGVQIRGTMQALRGGVRIGGRQGIFRCGVTGRTIQISGASHSVPVDDECRAD
jgi:hypothetical protein